MTLQIDYSVGRKWKNGFEATIAVTNTGLAPVSDWQITFDFFDVALVGLHDAFIVAETEGIYTIAPLPGGPALLPGGTATATVTARGNAARLPLFVNDDDEDDDGDGYFDGTYDDAAEAGLWTDPADTVVAFPGTARPGVSQPEPRGPQLSGLRTHIVPVTTHDMPANCDFGLSATDGLTLDDGEVRDLLARVDWLYFEGGAMKRVQGLLGMGDRMPLPRPSNENCDPLSAGSSSLSSNGSTLVPVSTPAVSGASGATTEDRRTAGTDADAVKEPARQRTSAASPSSAALQEYGPQWPFPQVPPRDDWLL